jgi:transcriptional regulator with XRE-family HTH domain
VGKPILPVAAGIVHDARTRAGISRAELARRLGVAPSAVSDWEAGKKDPSVSNLWRIVSACGFELRMRAAPVSQHEETQRETDRWELASGRALAHDVRGLAERFGVRSARAS